jgi:hypothetical protein
MRDMSDYETHRRKMQATHAAEAADDVADSMEVRLAIVRRMKAGEITLEEGQAELERIKRGAKRAGKITRAQAYRKG